MGRHVNQNLYDMRRQWAEELYKAHYTTKEAHQIIGCPYALVTVMYKEFKRTKVRKIDRSMFLRGRIQYLAQEAELAA